MTCRTRFSIVVMVLVTVLAVTACGDSGGEGQSTVPATATQSSTDVAEAQQQDTDSHHAAPTAPFIFATAPGQEPFDKAVPTGPAPTQAPAPPSDFDADGDGFYTYDELEQAVRYRYPSYDWPPNYQVTPTIIMSGFAPMQGKGARWEAPYEYTLIGVYHQCAWQFALLDAVHNDDAALMDESLYQLTEVNIGDWLSDDPEGQAFIEDIYGQAMLGDPASLQQLVDNNCESKDFITPSPTSSPQAHAALEFIARVEGKSIR